MIDPKLKERVVLITGANHGIGTAIALGFAEQGAKVFVTYFRRPLEPEFKDSPGEEPGVANYRIVQTKTADDVMRKIEEMGEAADVWEADLSDPANIPKLFDRAERSLGPVEIVVNNAAYGEADTFEPEFVLSEEDSHAAGFHLYTITAETHDSHFAVNSRGTALMMAEFARRHIKRGSNWGRIINISADGASGFPSEISYDASKHAMESYSRAAARELGKYGITVNVISPGAVQTGYIPAELQKMLEDDYPLRRIGEPKDIADAVVFMASEQARWITGQLLYVGGGNRMAL